MTKDTKQTAEFVKEALRRRHNSILPPLHRGGKPTPGQWTTIEEYYDIDMLAFAAWINPKPSVPNVGKKKTKYPTVGYEIKVSRQDMRKELLAPQKRARGVAMCHQFYFAIPYNLMKKDELDFHEPDEWGYRFGAGWKNYAKYYDRTKCPKCNGWKNLKKNCKTCSGKGYTKRSVVEDTAPTLWLPKDVGLVVVNKSGIAKEIIKAPVREPDMSLWNIGTLVRHASFRPDKKHVEQIVKRNS